MGLLDFLRRGPKSKRCVRCGERAAHGYSRAAESKPSEIAPLCLQCLAQQLHTDYSSFAGRAEVIAPAPKLPCYVFQNRGFLRSISSIVHTELEAQFSQLQLCAVCRVPAHCLWFESGGLSLDTFEQVLEKGLQPTILVWGNPPPLPLCGKCTAERICKALQANGMEFFEICSPHDTQEGIVLPMAY